MPRLPPNAISRQTRLRSKVLARRDGLENDSFPVAFELFRDELGEPVCVPCPISARATRITTVSSGLTTTHALTSGSVVVCAAAGTMPNGRLNERQPAARCRGADDEFAARELELAGDGVVHAYMAVSCSRLELSSAMATEPTAVLEDHHPCG